MHTMTPPMEGLIETATEIARRRAETLERLKEAVERDDREEAFNLAKELVGVTNEKSNRTDPRIN